MSKRNFITQVQSYDTNQVDIDSFCNDILFYNGCAGTVYIDGFPILTGATLMINGNEDEINTTKYKASFGTGNTGQLYVIRKKYV